MAYSIFFLAYLFYVGFLPGWLFLRKLVLHESLGMIGTLLYSLVFSWTFGVVFSYFLFLLGIPFFRLGLVVFFTVLDTLFLLLLPLDKWQKKSLQ